MVAVRSRDMATLTNLKQSNATKAPPTLQLLVNNFAYYAKNTIYS